MDKAQKRIVAILAALLAPLMIALVIVIVWRANNVQVGGFVPPAFDASAVKGKPENLDASYGYNTVSAQDSFSVSLCYTPIFRDGAVQLYFTSHSDNAVWLSAAVYDTEGNLLGESGLVRPGEYVQEIALNVRPEASREIILKIRTYEPDTYYSLGIVSGTLFLVVPNP